MRQLLRLAFGVIAVVWLVAAIDSLACSREVARNVRLIGDDSLARIRLVDRMGLDIERCHGLIDEYVFVPSPEVKARIERSIEQNRRDFDAAARAYETIPERAAEPDPEAQAKRRLEADVAALDGRMSETIALVRSGADASARAHTRALDAMFTAITRDVSRLADIKHDAAAHAEVAIGVLQRRETTFHTALMLLAFIATLALGSATTFIAARNERRLREDAEALAQKNRELDAFTGRVAHDLRGPLGTINMAAATLEKHVPESETAVAILRRGITRMDALIGDLLKLSRVAAVSLDAVADARAVSDAIEEELRRRAQEIDAELRVDVESADVRCDEGFLREVLWNLCENALKYRRDDVKAQVEVTGRVKPNVYHLRVSDNGTGMSDDDARHAFDPFFRAQRARSMPGTGLGLSIVKRIVEANGGKVSVRSQEGEGTVFLVELPLARAPRAAAR